MNVAFFGGSFDPPHIGHVLAVAYVLSVEAIDQVLVTPVFEHAFAKRLSPFRHRVRMTELAMQPLQRVGVSDIEERLAAPSYTLQTLKALQEAHPDHRFRLLIGSDILETRNKWRKFEQVAALAPPLVLPRTGFDAQASLLPRVSSTEVRSRLRATRGKPDPELDRWVPRAVLEYIREQGLYRNES